MTATLATILASVAFVIGFLAGRYARLRTDASRRVAAGRAEIARGARSEHPSDLLRDLRNGGAL